MQGLICSGSPISGGGGTALQQLFALHQISAMIKIMKTAGAAAPSAATQAAVRTGGGNAGNGGPGIPPPPPPSPSPAPAPADPSGDARAAATLGMARLPAPQTSI